MMAVNIYQMVRAKFLAELLAKFLTEVLARCLAIYIVAKVWKISVHTR